MREWSAWNERFRICSRRFRITRWAYFRIFNNECLSWLDWAIWRQAQIWSNSKVYIYIHICMYIFVHIGLVLMYIYTYMHSIYTYIHNCMSLGVPESRFRNAREYRLIIITKDTVYIVLRFEWYLWTWILVLYEAEVSNPTWKHIFWFIV